MQTAYDGILVIHSIVSMVKPAYPYPLGNYSRLGRVNTRYDLRSSAAGFTTLFLRTHIGQIRSI